MNNQDKLSEKVIQTFHTNSLIGHEITRQEVDAEVINLVLKFLYNGGDKKSASLKDDILPSSKINLDETQRSRLWKILISTGLVNSIIGFGKSGRLSITNQGYRLMNEYGSYSNFIEQKKREAANQSGNPMPQFIIETSDNDDNDQDEDEDGNNQRAAKNNDSIN